ncbi:triose-phosphate isomerase [Nitrosophilus kaiyonis]|uniref:triose-phosphate isomerase n=1 Tax=Nitrosophilus kaiyonis TaxID=2930200 RepID=UPI0024921F7A|nr:triose-phosphate isomerase [Nitrosophilus kaiyonis]
MILAANFKTNHTRKSTKEYIERLNNFLNSKNPDTDIFIFPPFTALDNYKSKATIGVQNAYPAEKGSFTGEIGLEQLNEFNIKTIIIGHSERRHILGENQEFIAKKFQFFKENNFTIFYCIGETIEVRESSKELIFSYLDMQLEGIDLDYENLIIAYEPVWAIGTGKSAKYEDIKEVLEFLRSKTKAPLLYGGSVKPSNIKEIISISNCDGALIGTASWNVDSFCEMVDLSTKN